MFFEMCTQIFFLTIRKGLCDIIESNVYNVTINNNLFICKLTIPKKLPEELYNNLKPQVQGSCKTSYMIIILSTRKLVKRDLEI